MDQKEYEALLASIEQMIDTSLRGYRRENHFRILGMSSDGDRGDQYIDANARGYREGCRGLKPEGTY